MWQPKNYSRKHCFTLILLNFHITGPSWNFIAQFTHVYHCLPMFIAHSPQKKTCLPASGGAIGTPNPGPRCRDCLGMGLIYRLWVIQEAPKRQKIVSSIYFILPGFPLFYLGVALIWSYDGSYGQVYGQTRSIKTKSLHLKWGHLSFSHHQLIHVSFFQVAIEPIDSRL